MCLPLEQAHAVQAAFAAAIRDPHAHPAPPGVPPRRMALYRELFFNNVASFLANGFPVLRKILSDRQWQDLAQDFFSRHACQTPLFAEISQEFLRYLSEERGTVAGDPPFLPELAHYEWVELAVSIAEDAPPPAAPGLYLSALAWPLAYRFPVQRLSPAYQPQTPPAQPTCLLVYRDAADAVHFVELSPAGYALLSRLQQAPATDADGLIRAVAADLGYADPAALLAPGRAVLEELRGRGVIIAQ